MHKNFIQAFTWNFSATFLYKIMLLCHQILLYSIIPKDLYGLQSLLFANIYIIISLTNFGFDETLLPFFSTYHKNRSNFLSLLHQFICHIITIGIVACVFYNFYSGKFLHNLQFYCNKNIIFIISLIFFIESLKKSTQAIMQLAFLYQQIAYAQLIMLSCYLGTIWSFYGFYKKIPLIMIFMPMVLTSGLELGYYLYKIWQYYQGLAQEPATPYIPFKVLIRQRIYNYINQITKAVYSPNSMTIFFTYIFGFQQAADIKFFTNIITLLYTCISKSVGITTGVVLSIINQMPVEQIRSFFIQVTQRYFQFLYLLTSLLILIVGYAWYTEHLTGIMALHILIFFSISFLEHVTITYEQLFMSQGKAWPLAMINLNGLFIIIPSLYLFLAFVIDQSTFLTIFITIKIASLWSIGYLAFQYWNISLKSFKNSIK